MSNKILSMIIGSMFAASLALSHVVVAAEAPAAAPAAEMKDGKCGGDKKDAKKTEKKAAKKKDGKCGKDMKKEDMKDGKCGGSPKAKDGKCGTGKCGAGDKK